MKPSKKVLVVEDEAPLLNALADKIATGGYTVFRASDGQNGLNQAIKEVPDLIMLDINLPLMDGITVLKNLRQNEACKNVEVVLLTNSNDPNILAAALQYNVHDYLVKADWGLDQVMDIVRNKLK